MTRSLHTQYNRIRRIHDGHIPARLDPPQSLKWRSAHCTEDLSITARLHTVRSSILQGTLSHPMASGDGERSQAWSMDASSGSPFAAVGGSSWPQLQQLLYTTTTKQQQKTQTTIIRDQVIACQSQFSSLIDCTVGTQSLYQGRSGYRGPDPFFLLHF